MIEKIKSKIIETLKNSEFANYYPDIYSYQGLSFLDYIETTNLFKPLILVTSDRARINRVGLFSHTAYPSYMIRFINNDYERNKDVFFDYDFIFSKCNELLLNNDLNEFFGTILNNKEISNLTLTSSQHYDVEYKRIVEMVYSTHFSLD